jgi:hypothetical protein
VVHDLQTTVSGVQSAIALKAFVSAAFILIGSKVGDLIGRKRAYVLGLGRAIGALEAPSKQHHPTRLRVLTVGFAILIPIVPRARWYLVAPSSRARDSVLSPYALAPIIAPAATSGIAA